MITLENMYEFTRNFISDSQVISYLAMPEVFLFILHGRLRHTNKFQKKEVMPIS